MRPSGEGLERDDWRRGAERVAQVAVESCGGEDGVEFEARSGLGIERGVGELVTAAATIVEGELMKAEGEMRAVG